MSLNEMAKYALISRALMVHFVWLNDKIQGTNLYAPHLKQASKSFNAEVQVFVAKWYKENLVHERTEMSFNEILTAWENLIQSMLFAEPEQINLVTQALKALKEQATVLSKGDLPKGFLIYEESGKYSLFKEQAVMRSNSAITKIEFVPTPVQGCETETQAYEKAFEYIHEIGLLPEIAKGGENE